MIRDIQDFACVLSEAPPVLMLLGPVSAWCVLDCLQKCLRVERMDDGSYWNPESANSPKEVVS